MTTTNYDCPAGGVHTAIPVPPSPQGIEFRCSKCLEIMRVPTKPMNRLDWIDMQHRVVTMGGLQK